MPKSKNTEGITKSKTRTCGVETLTGSTCSRRISDGKVTCFQHHHATGKKQKCSVPKNTKNVSWSSNLRRVKYVPKTEDSRKGLHLIPMYQMSEKDQDMMWDCAIFTLGEKYQIWERSDYMSAIRSKRFGKRQKAEMKKCAKFLGWIQ